MRSPVVLKTFIVMMESIMYEAPQVEVVEVEVEKGFAASDGGTTPDYDI